MNNTRFSVMLTFDVDAETLWTAPDPLIDDPTNHLKPSLMSQASYGPLVAIPRLLKLLDEYDIQSSFFIPGKTMEKYPDMVKEISKRGHEIGNHGYSHMCPVLCTDKKEEFEEYEKTSEILKKLINKRPVGFRAPSWEFSTNTVGILKGMDFLYDSSLMGDDKISMLDVFGEKTDLVEIPINWSLDDAPFWLLSNDVWGAPMPSPSAVFESWAEEFKYLYEEQKENCFVLTCHPQIIGRPGRLRMYERLIRYIKGHSNINFTTCEKAAEQFKMKGVKNG